MTTVAAVVEILGGDVVVVVADCGNASFRLFFLVDFTGIVMSSPVPPIPDGLSTIPLLSISRPRISVEIEMT